MQATAPIMTLLLCAAFAAGGAPARADACFDHDLLITRNSYPDPTDAATRWRDITLLSSRGERGWRALRLSLGALDESPYDNFAPAFTGEGGRILFLSNRGAGPNAALYAMSEADEDLDHTGDDLAYLGADDPELAGLHWPGGETLAYVAADGRGQAQVHMARVPRAGGALSERRALTGGGGAKSSPRLAPGGGAVLYLETVAAEGTGGDTGAGFADQLWLLRLEEGAEPRLLGSAARGAIQADWAGETSIVLSRADPATPDAPPDLWRLALTEEGASAERLTETPDRAETAPAVGQDGACLAYLSAREDGGRGGEGDVILRDLTTGAWHQVTHTNDVASVTWRGTEAGDGS